MNSYDSGRFCAETVESAAKRYKSLGFSIIPLNGATNPQEAKRPAIKWARFQHEQPTDDDLATWFHGREAVGVGIVCGRVSRLMVLDFDDEAVASEFRRLHPDLADTFTVRSGTRKLPHLYFRLPQGKLVTTTAYRGVDLRGEGAYVVAPPTRAGRAVWVVSQDVPVRAIGESDLRRLMGFLASLQQAEKAVVGTGGGVEAAQASEFRRLLVDTELVELYERWCDLGRNQALFRAAAAARDSGMSEATCVLVLGSVHARREGTCKETYAARYHEAVRTIASAYKRGRRRDASDDCGRSGLGNAVREWFLGNGLTCAARVLDGLYAVGIVPGTTFTEREACLQLAHLRIGRRSIMAALTAVIGGQPVFEVANPPWNPQPAAVAANGENALNNSCEMSRGAKRVKNAGRGRPAKRYLLPDPENVAHRLGITVRTSDLIGAEALGTARTYRQALHRQFLARRPGHYARTWLAARIGVSRWTTRRYEKADGLYVRMQYTERPLAWGDMDRLARTPADLAYGVFLEGADGKRYPAVQGLAMRLLRQGYSLTLKQQQPNFYAASASSVGIPTPAPIPASAAARLSDRMPEFTQSQQGGYVVDNPSGGGTTANKPTADSAAPSSVGIPTPAPPEPIFWLCPQCLDYHVKAECPGECDRCHTHVAWEIVPPAIWRDPQALQQWWRIRYQAHRAAQQTRLLMPQEARRFEVTDETRRLAEHVRGSIPGLSFANACGLVKVFGERLIQKALNIIRHRAGIRSPAGYLIAYLKAEQKLLFGNKTSVEDVRESPVEWVKRLAKSKYVNFLSNADEILSYEPGGDYVPARA